MKGRQKYIVFLGAVRTGGLGWKVLSRNWRTIRSNIRVGKPLRLNNFLATSS